MNAGQQISVEFQVEAHELISRYKDRMPEHLLYSNVGIALLHAILEDDEDDLEGHKTFRDVVIALLGHTNDKIKNLNAKAYDALRSKS